MIVTSNLPMRRGSELICLETSIVIPVREILLRSATIPIMVDMQPARAAPTKSVGEKLSPLP